jgi:hypothetical protein
MENHRKRITDLLLLPLAAAVVFFEQTLIRCLNVMMAALAQWTPVMRLEAWLVRLPPRAALLVFVAPSIIVLPVKLSAVWLVAHGQYGLALAAVAGGKLVATAMVGRLYWLLRPTLRTIAWFARLDTWFFDWRDRIYAFVRALPAWQAAAALVQRTRTRLAELVSALLPR